MPKILFILLKSFIHGLMYIILLPINIYKFIIQKNKNIINYLILGMSLSVYFITIFIATRWYVQTEKTKYLIKDIIASTEIVKNDEENINEDINNEDPNNSNIQDNGNNSNGNNNQSSNNNYTNDYWDYINVPYLNIDFNTLKKINPDVVGWLKVENTNVNYPVVKSNDNSYYLKHDFRKNSNSAGWIFLDYRNDLDNLRKNSIIYGHNMINNTMFGSIPDNVLSNTWLSNPENHLIKLSTPNSNMVWKIFSVYTIEPESYYIKTLFNNIEYQQFIDTIKSRSIYNFNEEVNINDKILTLSTCDNSGKKRVVVHAKLIKSQ